MFNIEKVNQKKTEIMNALANAVRENNEQGMADAMNAWQNEVSDAIMAQVAEMSASVDTAVLAQRGTYQLTSEEKAFYNKFIESARADATPATVITGIMDVLPGTVIDRVLSDMRQNHPLLDAIDFQNTAAAVKIVLNKKGSQTATWDVLNTPITKDLAGEIEVLDMTLCKLTAYMYVTKDMLNLGPVWVDAYVRNVLSEALATGLETAIVDGSGDKQPIGMTRNFKGAFNDGYNRKSATSVPDFGIATYSSLIGTLAKDSKNNYRAISEVILIVNPADYFTKVMPATTAYTVNGQFENNRFPYPTKVIQSVGVQSGHAVLGIAKNYFMGLGTSKGGRIEYDDSYKFLEDLRTYTIRLYGNGRPLDINDFAYLDISAVKAAIPQVAVVGEITTTEA